MYFSIFSLWCGGQTRRWVTESGERSVLTLDSLCLPCSVLDTTWSWFDLCNCFLIFFRLYYDIPFLLSSQELCNRTRRCNKSEVIKILNISFSRVWIEPKTIAFTVAHLWLCHDALTNHYKILFIGPKFLFEISIFIHKKINLKNISKTCIKNFINWNI